MIKPIEIKNNENNDVYILEFNLDTVKFAETHGFDLQAVGSGKTPITSIADLFYYAFRMHHPRMSRAETDKMLFNDLGGIPEGMLERLVQLYQQPFEVLIPDEERKNSKLTVSL